MKITVRFLNIFIFLFLMGFVVQSHAAAESAQTITLDGTLYSQDDFSSVLLDGSAQLKIQILDPSKTCVLYEETQVVNTTTTQGKFNIQVGSVTGAGKRSGDDPGHAMSTILQNVVNITATNGTCVGGVYNPTSGDARHLRLEVTPSSTGVPIVMSPDMTVSSIPNALVCESIQGLDRDKLLEFGAHINAAMTAANALKLFDGSDAGTLHHHDGEYAKLSSSNSISMGSQQTIGFGEFTNAQETTLTAGLGAADAGKTWYNSDTDKLMYWDGSTAQEIGSGGGGAVTSVFGRTGVVAATAGDYTATQITNSASGDIAAVTVQAAINELDGEKLSLTGGTMTGVLAMGANKVTSSATPTVGDDLTNKTYVDSAISTAGGSFVAKAGDTMSGALAMGSSKITGLGDPTAAQDAATKTYVDSNLRGSNLPAPGAGQDGQSIQWNNGTGAWVYYTPSTGDVSSSRDMIAGSGLTGGGTLAADRTFNVGAGSGISVAADSVSVDINGTTAEATIADGDEILIHDVSAGALRKMTKANFVSGLGGGSLSNVVEDTTPQLGGNLDVNGNNFTSAAGVDFAIGASAGNDFTVDTDKLVVEGDTGNVGIGTASPNAKLTIEGVMTLDQQASDPTGTAGYGSLYTKADGSLYYRNGTGAITDLLAGGGWWRHHCSDCR